MLYLQHRYQKHMQFFNILVSHIKLFPVFFLSLIFFFVSGVGAQNLDHWESIIKTGDSVLFWVPDSEPDADWKTMTYNDSGWAEGISGIGYGDGDDSTEIDQCISVYIRYKFSIPDTSVIGALLLDMDYDDAFVAYLNGTEIARANIGESFSP